MDGMCSFSQTGQKPKGIKRKYTHFFSAIILGSVIPSHVVLSSVKTRAAHFIMCHYLSKNIPKYKKYALPICVNCLYNIHWTVNAVHRLKV